MIMMSFATVWLNALQVRAILREPGIEIITLVFYCIYVTWCWVTGIFPYCMAGCRKRVLGIYFYHVLLYIRSGRWKKKVYKEVFSLPLPQQIFPSSYPGIIERIVGQGIILLSWSMAFFVHHSGGSPGKVQGN